MASKSTSAALTVKKSDNNALALIDLLEFAIPAKTRGQLYPALQVSSYRPAMGSQIFWVLNPESAGLLSESAKTALKLTEVICHYDNPTVMHQINADIRFAVIAQPETFTQHKESKAIDYLREGVTFKDNGLVSIAKVMLVPIVDGTPILNDNGIPQIVTLKLTSTKVLLIKNRDAGVPSLATLNRDLCTQLKKGSGIWLLHLTSIGLTPTPRKLSSATDPKLSSIATVFDLDPTPQLLDREDLPGIFALAQTQEVLDYAANPFGIKEVGGEFVPEFTDVQIEESKIAF